MIMSVAYDENSTGEEEKQWEIFEFNGIKF